MKKRLDILLTEQGFFPTREKSRQNVMAGQVLVNNQVCEKPGTLFDDSAKLFVKENTIPFVSRGGLKLQKALKVFPLDLNGRICLDIGASTGGFTDCMLQQGARKIYAVDVGYGQLDWKLRTDSRVVVLERTNFRYIDPSKIPDLPDFISADVSFISLLKLLPAMALFLHPQSELLMLIKPQFEATREEVKKHGVIRDPHVHQKILKQVIAGFMLHDLYLQGLDFSPVKGPKGNIEYLAWFTGRPSSYGHELEKVVDTIVQSAHETLGG